MLAPIVVTNTFTSGAGSLRAAIFAANDTGARDEIVFDASLFASGTPVINLSAPISVTEPVKIHSPHGPVIIQKASSAQEALLLVPNLTQGIAQDFEIRDLLFANFKYGVRVNDAGGVPDATVESVKIIGNGFLNNERGIFFEDALFPFEIAENQIVGRGAGVSPTDSDAGIYITNPTTQTNSFTALIRDNTAIGSHDGSGIYVLGAKITNLSITGNGIGKDQNGNASPNNTGILIQNAEMPNGVIEDNEIVNNGGGVVILFTDGVDIIGNEFADNVDTGLELLNTAIDHRILDNDFVSNGGTGIAIGAGLSDLSIRNRVSDNYFLDNGGPPVDLGNNGVIDANDGNDLDEGPNRRMNHPVVLSSQIVDEGTRWRVPVQFDTLTPGKYRFEFYRHVPATGLYEFIRPEVRTLSGGADWNENLYFERGTELNAGEHLAALAIWDETTSGTVVGDTSELVSTSGPMPDAGPRVADVVLKGSSWADETLAYSYAELAPQGKQLFPVFTAGVNTIQVQFSRHVNVTQSNLKLYGTSITGAGGGEITSTGFVPINPVTHIATWSFPALEGDKYRIDIEASVTDSFGNMLNGEWGDPTNGTPNNRTDDIARAFPSGDGTAGTNGNRFQFMFAALPGDYNQDGIVDGADQLAIGSTGFVADGNGDGMETIADDDVVDDHMGERLSFGRLYGDYNNDDTTDELDESKWKMQFGMAAAELEADGNNDGFVNAADAVIIDTYQEKYITAWRLDDNGAGGAFALEEYGDAPRVIEVTISGSASFHDPFAFSSVDGSGEQLRTVPVGGADTVSITFDENVNVVASNLRVTGLSTGNIPTIAEFSYDVATMTATWRLEGWALGDHYLISLSDAVTDIDGNLLDGEWVNPRSITTTNAAVSEFPSGDGEAGGKFNFIATLLPGDANLDLIVDGGDLNILLTNFHGATVGQLFVNADFNGDGDITGADMSLMFSNYYVNLQSVFILSDLNGDSVVDNADADILNDHYWSANPTYEDGDLNGDGDIDELDIDLMFAQFGLEIDLVS